jgi:uncharacterized protein YdeI (YjbR/CyaY-like superfamily)
VNAFTHIKDDLPVLLFELPVNWSDWLEQYGQISSGIWMRIAKKGSDLRSVTYDEALDIALCYGWIDGLKQTCDKESWLQRFTPRKKKSNWSQINVEKALKLIAEGKMKTCGMDAIDEAKRNGNWEKALAAEVQISIPAYIKSEFMKYADAFSFFNELDRRNRLGILRKIEQQKSESARRQKLAEMIRMLSEKKKLYT